MFIVFKALTKPFMTLDISLASIIFAVVLTVIYFHIVDFLNKRTEKKENTKFFQAFTEFLTDEDSSEITLKIKPCHKYNQKHVIEPVRKIIAEHNLQYEESTIITYDKHRNEIEQLIIKIKKEKKNG